MSKYGISYHSEEGTYDVLKNKGLQGLELVASFDTEEEAKRYVAEVDNFECCGGNDDRIDSPYKFNRYPQGHTQDCPARMTGEQLIKEDARRANKPTPRPWRLGTQGYGLKNPKGEWVSEPCYSIFANDETPSTGPSSICTTRESDAAHIVKCVNMHDELVGLVKALRAERPLTVEPTALELRINNLLAKAEGRGE